MQRNARRGLDLLEFKGPGLEARTIREARRIAAGEVSEQKVARMAGFFQRHVNDHKSERARDYVAGRSDRPSPGQVSWLLWGGDIAESTRFRAMEWAIATRDRLRKVDADAVRVGRAYLYAVPKPPGPTEFGTGVAVRVYRTGTIREAGDTREASAQNPAVLLQVYSVDEDRRLRETDRQVLRSASELRAAGDISDRIDKQVSAAVRQTLENKVAEHNEKHGSAASKRVNVRMLSAVFERGLGAYRNNPGSVRPSVTSANQWAMARVNVFLRAVRTGSFPRSAFDTDLLPEGHRLSTRKMMHGMMPRFSPEIEAKLKEHAEHHTGKHMRMMRHLMAGGMTFEEAHERAMRDTGKEFVEVESYYHDEDDEMKAHHLDDEMKGYGYMDEDKAYHFQKEIVEEDGKFCVYSQGRGRKFGCYETRAAAQERLNQIESFSYSLESMTAKQLIVAHDLIHKSSTVTDDLRLAHDVIEDHLEAEGYAPPYTTGDLADKYAALHDVVPFAKAEERYTLGPVYVPGRIDGHGEFITSDTLQKAIWNWVRSGDRTIYLQHSEKAAGEMVEILTWPMPIQTSLTVPGETVHKVEPPGS